MMRSIRKSFSTMFATRTGKLIVVASAVSIAIAVIAITALASKNVISRFGGTGGGAGQFASLPAPGVGGVAVNQTGAGGVDSGDVYVADTSGNRIEEFSFRGDFVRAFGFDVTGSGHGDTGVNEQQTVTVKATAGTFTLTATVAKGVGTTSNSTETTTLRNVSTLTGAYHVGDTITGTGIPASTTITGIDTVKHTLTISKAATSSGENRALTATETTAAIAFNETASGAGSVQEKLEALAGIGTSDVTVTGGPGNETGTSPYTVTFAGGGVGGNDVTQMTATATLTGGAKTATVATTIPGGGYEGCEASASPADVCQTGGAAASNGAMSAPQNVAVDQSNGNVYVTDNRNLRVDVFSAAGQFEGAWGLNVDATNSSTGFEFCPSTDTCQAGTSGAIAGAFASLKGIAVNPANDDVIVADPTNKRVDDFSVSVSAGTVTGATFVKAFGGDVVSTGPDNGGTTNEEQSLKIAATSGTFTLTFGRQTTSAINYSAEAKEVETALNALSSIGGAGASVSVSGGRGDITGSSPYVVTFNRGALQGTDVEQTTINTAGLGVAVGTVLTCNVTAGANPTYQWLRNGAPILGATSTTYTTTSEDEGKPIQCQIVAGTSGTPTIQQNTPATVVSPYPATSPSVPAESSLPRPKGSFMVGSRLRCESPGTWSGSPSFSYQWYHNGTALSGHGANTPEYELQAADNPSAKATWQCSVTATTGGGSVTLSSGELTSGGGFPIEAQLNVTVPSSASTSTTGVPGYEVCTPTDGDVCKVGLEGMLGGMFGKSGPTALAAGSNGNIYVVDQTNGRLQEFNSSAAVPSESPNASKAEFVAIDASNNDIYVVVPAGSERDVLRLSSSGSLLETNAEGNGLIAVGGIAYLQSRGNIYLTLPVPTEEQVAILNEVPPPAVTIGSPTGVTSECLTFHGTVNPNPDEITSVSAAYQFEYSKGRGLWTAVPAEVNVGNGITAVPVEQTACDLSPSSFYVVRLKARGTGGTSTSDEVTFETAGAVPVVATTYAAPIGSTTATLAGAINPNNSPTTYYFQYVDAATYMVDKTTGDGFQHAFEVPATPRHIGTGSGAVNISESAAGLKPYTTYEIRIVATNEVGTVEGPVQVFTTAAVLPAPGRCPNETLREENRSSGLPDCRAYEQITPTYKQGSGPVAHFGGPRNRFAVSPDGSNLIDTTYSAVFAGGNAFGGPPLANYEFERDSNARWVTTALSPLATVDRLNGGKYELVATSTDNITKLFLLRLTESSDRVSNTLYLMSRDSALNVIGPIYPGAKGISSLRFEGASEDLSRVTFGSEGQVYEYHGLGHTGVGTDAPILVGVDNSGVGVSGCGDVIGGSGSAYNAISASGATVFLHIEAERAGCRGPAVSQLVARVGTDPAMAVTVNVAGTTGCSTSISCDVTDEPQFRGASQNGSKVFFTTRQALSASDVDGTSDLYECELPGDTGTALKPSGRANSCPSLKPISVTGVGQGAKVQGVARISEDGSHVYYVATGIVTDQPNALGERAAEGEDNLYVYEPDMVNPSRYINRFIVRLASSDGEDWRADDNRPVQSSPDGRYLVFESSANLTPDDTLGAAQVFEYDAYTARLRRISVGQAGEDNDGNAVCNIAHIPRQIFDEGVQFTTSGNVRAGLAMSYDGEVIVFTSPCALTADAEESDASTGAPNIYEYRRGDVQLVADGQAVYGTSEKPPGTSEQLYSEPLVGVSEAGADIYFLSSERLAAADTDTQIDIYDARVDGGFAKPVTVSECTDEGCRSPISEAVGPVALASTNAPEVGNSREPQQSLSEPESEESETNAKKQTKAQSLARALKQCRKGKPRAKKRKACEKKARKKYGKAKGRPKK